MNLGVVSEVELFFRNITADYRRIYDLADRKSRLVRIVYPFTCPGFHALLWYRLIQANRRWRIPVLFYIFAIPLRMINTFVQWFWGICIASNCEIGPGLYIAHHGQIFIGVKSMGSNCTIGHNVTVGRTEKEHGYPTIGNNVYIAPGALVIGNVIIEDNVKIGPNAVVRRNIKTYSVVMAPPPRVIRMTSKEQWQKEKEAEAKKPPAESKPYHPRNDYRKTGYKRPYNQPHKQPAKTGSSQERQPQGHQSDRRDADRNYTDRRNADRRDSDRRDNRKGNYRNRDNRPYHPRPSNNRPRPDKQNSSNHPRDNERSPQEQKPDKETHNGGDIKLDRKDNPEKGSSWGGGSKQNKWANDMEGENLDG